MNKSYNQSNRPIILLLQPFINAILYKHNPFSLQFQLILFTYHHQITDTTIHYSINLFNYQSISTYTITYLPVIVDIFHNHHHFHFLTLTLSFSLLLRPTEMFIDVFTILSMLV